MSLGNTLGLLGGSFQNLPLGQHQNQQFAELARQQNNADMYRAMVNAKRELLAQNNIQEQDKQIDLLLLLEDEE